MNYVSTHTYDDQTVRWLLPDPAEQFHNPYLAMGRTKREESLRGSDLASGQPAGAAVMDVDPDGEFAIIAALIIAKKIAAKVAIGAKFAGAYAKAGAKIVGTASKFAANKVGAVAAKSATKTGMKAGFKSGSINTISNYDSEEGLGWHTLGDFAAGYAGGSFGYGSGSKLIGMGVGGFGTWGVNGASFDYEGGQEFVGGALSSYIGMGKAVQGKHALFKQAEGMKTLASFKKQNVFTKTLMKHGDNFVKYGLQNNAYDFAYTKEEDFRSRQGGHLDLFLWGGVSGAFQQYSWTQKSSFHFGKSPLFMIADWGINGAIKKRYDSIKYDGSQLNKLVLNHGKWGLQMSDFLRK